MWNTKEPGGRSGRIQDGAPERPVGVVEWVRERLGVAADPPQAQVLGTRSRRGILNCSRQCVSAGLKERRFRRF